MSFADRDGVIWFDGELVPWRDAKVHVLTHTAIHTCHFTHCKLTIGVLGNAFFRAHFGHSGY